MSMSDLSKGLKALHGRSVDIGWFESNRYNTGTPVAAVAAWNELGSEGKPATEDKAATPARPARPFMRLGIDNGNATIDVRVSKSTLSLLQGKKTVDQVLHDIGYHYENAIVESIKGGGWEANAPSTVARKGFDTPLIYSGIMWQTVNHVIS